MNKFRLNLIRDQVPSLAKRRMRFGSMMIYLALAGLVLVVAVGMASSRISQALENRTESRRLEQEYVERHDGQAGIQRGVSRLQTRLASQVDSLQSVADRLSHDPRPARFIRALVSSLPPSMALYKVGLDAEEQTVTFEIRMFAPAGDSSMGAPELMKAWQQDPALKAEITQLTYVGSHAEKAGVNGNTLLQFSGRLEKKEP